MMVIGSWINSNTSFDRNPVETDAITSVTISNAEYDELYIDKTADVTIGIGKEWGYGTILYAKFDGNLYAGNAEFMLNNIDTLRVKRREKGAYEWITLLEKPVKSLEDINFTLKDTLVKADTEFEYAFVPVHKGIENKYNVAKVKSEFKGLFIIDTDKIYHTDLNINNCGNLDYERKFERSVIHVLDSKYPYIIKNGQVNYDTGTVSATFIEIDCENNTINWNDGWQYRRDLIDFLTNNKAKILKDETGAIWLVEITDNSISNAANGHFYNTVTTFKWTEIGNVNDSNILNQVGLLPLSYVKSENTDSTNNTGNTGNG